MTEISIEIRNGFAEKDREKIVTMYWNAFAEKLKKILTGTQAKEYLRDSFDQQFALCAYTNDDELVGVAGLYETAGCFCDISFNSMIKYYGVIGSFWRTAIFWILDRPVKENELWLDDLFVDENFRGHGVGGKLLVATEAEAKKRKKQKIILEVVDHNVAAKRLYLRHGYKVIKKNYLGIFKYFFDFESSKEMTKEI